MSIVESEHRRVENTEDFTQWEWGETPDQTGSIRRNYPRAFQGVGRIHRQRSAQKSCAAGAQIAFEELAENGFFRLDGH